MSRRGRFEACTRRPHRFGLARAVASAPGKVGHRSSPVRRRAAISPATSMENGSVLRSLFGDIGRRRYCEGWHTDGGVLCAVASQMRFPYR